MQTYAEQAELLYAETVGPRRRAEEELAMGKETGANQRAAGGHMLGEVERGLRDEMERYGVQVEGEMQGLREGVDGVCERFGEVAGDGRSLLFQCCFAMLGTVAGLDSECRMSSTFLGSTGAYISPRGRSGGTHSAL